jgi:hypothetical protein
MPSWKVPFRGRQKEQHENSSGTFKRGEANTGGNEMKSVAILFAGFLLAGSAAYAQQLSAGSADPLTLGKLWTVEPSGQVNAAIVGVGGFLGTGEKDIAVKFNAIKATTKDNKTHLTMDKTNDALKNAPGFKYDSNKTAKS